MNKDGESREGPAGPLESSLSKVVGALVILCIILVVSYVLLAFDGESIKTDDQKISDSIRAADNTQRRHLAQVESLQREANRLLKRARDGDFDRGNCTDCDGRFVTAALFESNVTALEDTISAVNRSLETQIDGIQREIDGFLDNLNRTISNCSDCLPRVTLDAFQAEAEQQIASLSNYSLLSTDNYAKAYGAFGPTDEYGKVSDLWIMSTNVFCEGLTPIVDQLQSTSLAFRRVQVPGRCPNSTVSNGPLMYRKPGGPITFCPCETGLYSISVNVGNLNLWITSPDLYPITPDERGSYFSLGLVYSPPGGTDPLLFDSNPFPLAPIVSYSSTPLGGVDLPVIETGLIPTVNLNEVLGTTPFGKANTGLRWLNRTVGDDDNACYDFVMNVNDPFVFSESLCYDNETAQIDHTFFYPYVPAGMLGVLRFRASVTVQRVAWKEGGPVP